MQQKRNVRLKKKRTVRINGKNFRLKKYRNVSINYFDIIRNFILQSRSKNGKFYYYKIKSQKGRENG
jgi:hypothetical protein